jgi:hypothetical protein
VPAELTGAEIEERHRSSNGKDVQQKQWFLALTKQKVGRIVWF